ncbi:MAG: hypothetical protein GX777_02155 [Fastidiosipila sp.]|nr:hypothetical protein [Fastidiosipila sp.]
MNQLDLLAMVMVDLFLDLLVYLGLLVFPSIETILINEYIGYGNYLWENKNWPENDFYCRQKRKDYRILSLL